VGLWGGGVLGSKTLDFFVGGRGFSFSNFLMLVASVLGSSLGLGSSLARPLVGSTVSVGAGTSGLGMGIPALETRFTLVPESPPPMPPHGLAERWIKTLGATAAMRPLCSQAGKRRKRLKGRSVV